MAVEVAEVVVDLVIVVVEVAVDLVAVVVEADETVKVRLDRDLNI